MMMAWLYHYLRRARGLLIYMTICAAVMLALRQRAWEHVSTLAGNEWDTIPTIIRANHREGEPLCILPSWTVGHATEDYRFQDFERLARPRDAWQAHPEPLSGFWVVSQFGAFDPESIERSRYPNRSHFKLGQADIYVFRRLPFDDLESSLVSRLGEAACTLHGPERRRLALEWNRMGFRLPPRAPESETMSYLGCRIVEARFSGRPQVGIWFHPPPPNQHMTLTWDRITIAPWLEVAGGLVDQVAGRSVPPVELVVTLDDRELATLEYPSERGWKRHALATGVDDHPGQLRFEVHTTNNHSRHFVFDATMSRERPVGAAEPNPRSAVPTTDGRTDSGPAGEQEHREP